MARKFIVTSDGRFKFGDVAMHKELLAPDESCIGGGMYDFDYINGRMLLSGKSYDFGRVKWGWIDTLVLPLSLQGFSVLYEDVHIDNFVTISYD